MSDLSEAIAKAEGDHRQALQWFADNSGSIATWAAISAHAETGPRLANLAKGIFKPAYTDYALSVKQLISSPYADSETDFHTDGSWRSQYHQEGSDPNHRDQYATNRGLVKCMNDVLPVGVMLQTKAGKGAEYRILGLALVVDWQDGFFTLEGFGSDGQRSSNINLAAIEKLKATKDNLEVQKIVNDRNEVLERFGPIFQPSAVVTLEEGDFRQFLSIKFNKHWTGLERQPELYADMDRLREALSVLVDETKPIHDRVNTAIEAPGMGVAKLSAILHVAYPKKYGVWNGTSEKGLQHVDLWPNFTRGATTGEKYEAVNQVLLELASSLGIDLWTLDALWWGLDLNGSSTATGTGKVRIGNSKAKAIADMKYSILNTVKNSNGQMVETTIKNKDLKMLDRELDALLPYLLEKQDERCAITGLPFEYDADPNMRPSTDRIDSDGHYEVSNLQLVCRFINFWKKATPDGEFRRLIQVVRDSKSADDLRIVATETPQAVPDAKVRSEP